MNTSTYFCFIRYNYQRVGVETEVVSTIREQLARRSVVDSGLRNLLRLLTVTAGYPEVRQLAAQRLEMWLQNPKVSTHNKFKTLMVGHGGSSASSYRTDPTSPIPPTLL